MREKQHLGGFGFGGLQRVLHMSPQPPKCLPPVCFLAMVSEPWGEILTATAATAA